MTKKQKRELIRIVTALVIYAVLLILEHSPVSDQVFFDRWESLGLYLVPYLIAGWDVLLNAVRGIIHLQMLDESFLMTIATFGAFATSQYAEGCAVMLFYQVGEFFQDYAVNRSRKSITDLMEIAPETAFVEREDGNVEEIDPEEVQVGDILVVRPGEKVPVDGVVLTGESMLNTAALTGESLPRSIHPGDAIISGCVNGEGLLRIRAEKKYEDSTVARILEMVEEAADRKSKTENFITRFARIYTPLVVLGAVLVAFVPPLATGGSWVTWIYRACTFLVISCPCALVISVPLAFFGGIGAASRNGILVKGSNYLEMMAMLKTLVSDKTGTLTKGNFCVTEVRPAEGVTKEDVLEAAAAAEGLSTHPIAVSIQSALGHEVRTDLVLETENVTGKGIAAKTKEGVILAGNGRLMEQYGIGYVPAEDQKSTVVYTAKDGRYLGAILIADEIKPEAAEAIREIKDEGVKNVVMLTGDRREVAEEVGRELGVDTVLSELLPEGKVTSVESLIESEGEKEKTGFIGDGINDAPVLARADVGIAMGSMGSDAAIEAADIVIMDDNIRKVPVVIRIARRTIRISKENIWFALVVKFAILILAAIGIANMWAAVFADVGVACICILNSMRLLSKRKYEKKGSKPVSELQEQAA